MQVAPELRLPCLRGRLLHPPKEAAAALYPVAAHPFYRGALVGLAVTDTCVIRNVLGGGTVKSTRLFQYTESHQPFAQGAKASISQVVSDSGHMGAVYTQGCILGTAIMRRTLKMFWMKGRQYMYGAVQCLCTDLVIIYTLKIPPVNPKPSDRRFSH